MKKYAKIFTIMSFLLIGLVFVACFSTYKIAINKTTLTSVSLGNSIKYTSANQENTIKNIINKDFEDLIYQSAMIVGINKAIEESKTTEIKDSKEDILQEEKEEQKSVSPYYIKINYTANTVTVYQQDSNGNYTVPKKAFVCSTGKDTPRSGIYKTQNKYQWKLLNGGVYGQYSTRITGSILFHSVPYRTNSKNALISRYYDQLGITASAGCVRLTVADAKWIYDNCPLGTQVEFYKSSNPGPLGKPLAKKISSYPNNIKCWDPTDPDSNNPWHTYKEETTKTQELPNNTNVKLEQNQNEIQNQNKLPENNTIEENKNYEQEKQKT